MARDIEQLTDALRRGYPEITIEQRRTAHSGADDGFWYANHPQGFTEVQIESSTGDVPFLIESDLAPPIIARAVDDAVRIVTERLGLTIQGL
jgi:hypothetical protein